MYMVPVVYSVFFLSTNIWASHFGNSSLEAAAELRICDGSLQSWCAWAGLIFLNTQRSGARSSPTLTFSSAELMISPFAR